MNEEEQLFGDLTPFINEIKNGMDISVEASERALGYIVLPDGRRAEITVKINACEDEWCGE